MNVYYCSILQALVAVAAHHSSHPALNVDFRHITLRQIQQYQYSKGEPNIAGLIDSSKKRATTRV